MPYNEDIDFRIRGLAGGWPDMESKRMFGGICHLRKGNMFCGVYREFLILRLGEEGAAAAMALPHVRPFDITGKAMKGWVMVEEGGFPTDEELAGWLGRARDFAASLPPKAKNKKQDRHEPR